MLVHLSLQRRFVATVEDTRDSVADIGYPSSLDMIRADAAWLDETGLAQFDPQSGVLRLTERGLDVATGNAMVPGVHVPGPARG
jgi:hypothetical protein